MEKSADAFRTISEVSDILGTPAHVLRFWESRFPQIRPVKRAGGRRYYRPSDVALLGGIRRLLHDDGLTIRGVQKVLREQGIRHVAGLASTGVANRAEALCDRSANVTADASAGATANAAPTIVVAHPRAVAQKKPATPRRPATPAPDAAPRQVAEPLPLWVAAVERVGTRTKGQQAAPAALALTKAAVSDADAWLPPLLRALPPAIVAKQRSRLTDIQTRLLALHSRVADAARRPAP